MIIMEYNKPHHHRWMFLMVKGNYELVEGTGMHQFVEYAYLVCNGPTHTPIVVKQPVDKLENVEIVDGKQ